MNDDQYFLANAYHDGELTGDDLRIAEADPDVMSEVERLRSVQSLMRNTDAPSATVRAAAIAAAMAEFAVVTRTATTNDGNEINSPLTNANVITIKRDRPAYSRYLGVAAALAAIGVAGLVVAGAIGGGSDESSDSSEAITGETIAQTGSELARSASATTAAAEMENASDDVADQMLVESAPVAATAADGALGDESAATVTASESAGGETLEMTAVNATPYPPTGGPIEPIADRDLTITTPGQLAGLGMLLADLRDSGALGPTPETSCLFDDPAIEIVDSTRYRLADETVNVLVGLVAGDIEGHTLAIDPDTCEILVVGP